MQGLKTAQSVTDAKPDLGHTDKLPSSTAFLAKNWVRWQKWHLSVTYECAVRSSVCEDVCAPLGTSAVCSWPSLLPCNPLCRGEMGSIVCISTP